MVLKIRNTGISVHCILACLYFILLPTTIAVNSSGASILKLATIPIGIYFVIALILSKTPLRLNVIHFFLVLFTFSVALTLFVNLNNVAIKNVIGYFLNAALYICLSAADYNERELKLMEDIQVLLLVILIGITLFSNGSMFDRATFQIFGQSVDPNYFVGFLIFPFTVTMKRIVQSKHRLIYLLFAILALYCVFSSGSRGGLIALLVTIVAFALIYPPKMKYKAFILLGALGACVILWFLMKPLLPDNIIERFTIESVTETGGTGRWFIWESMLREIMSSPKEFILGRGTDALHELFLNGKQAFMVAHNQLIQVLYSQGIVGLISFLLLTIACFFRCIKKRNVVSIAIIGMMALAFSLSFNQTSRTFWNLVAYAAILFPENKNSVSTEKNKLSEES